MKRTEKREESHAGSSSLDNSIHSQINEKQRGFETSKALRKGIFSAIYEEIDRLKADPRRSVGVEASQPGSKQEKKNPSSPKWKKVFGWVRMTYKLWVEVFAAEIVELANRMPAAQRRNFRTHAQNVRTCASHTIKQARREHRAGKAQSQGKKRKVMRSKHGGGRFTCNSPGCLYRVRVRAWKFSKRLQGRLQTVLSRSRKVAFNKVSAERGKVRDARVRYTRSRGTPIEGRQRRHLKHVRTVHEELQGASSWRVHHVTLNLQFNSRDPANLTVSSLRQRFGMLKQVVPQLWKGLFDPTVRTCMAAAWRIEVGHHGLVHLHLWYLGPARSEEDFITVAEAHANDAFSAKVKRVKRGEETKVLAYVAKPDGIRAENWKRFKRGQSRRVPDPRLYARWAVATWKQDTVGTLGLFRRAR